MSSYYLDLKNQQNGISPTHGHLQIQEPFQNNESPFVLVFWNLSWDPITFRSANYSFVWLEFKDISQGLCDFICNTALLLDSCLCGIRYCCFLVTYKYYISCLVSDFWPNRQINSELSSACHPSPVRSATIKFLWKWHLKCNFLWPLVQN